MRLLGFADQPVDALHEFVPGRVWAGQDQILRVLRKKLLLRRPGPAPQVAVHQKRKATKVLSSSRIPQIAQDVLETESYAGFIHAALQHKLGGHD